ncbi:glycoside hydrolase family 15 protein, partial [Plenodomus tracheiphilus IPT5]
MLLSILLVSQFAHYTYAFSIPRLPRLSNFVSVSHTRSQQQPLQDTLDVWIEREEQIALERLFANIAPGGSNVRGKGVAPGTVVASPSQDGPDYWYQWVRDAAITMDTLVDIYANDPSFSRASEISTILDAYTSLQRDIQQTSNPSGTFDDLSSLGEPKFHVDGTPFMGSWGRPQRDGPALRSLTLMHYLREYNASHPSLWISEDSDEFFGKFYTAEMPPRSVIKADLEYVSHYWNESSFDLWEEVEGLHFFNLIVSARSLREGSKLAMTFKDPGAAEWYSEQASYIEALLSKFWNPKKGHLVETLWSKRSGLDCGIFLGSLHALPSTGSEDTPIDPPWSDEILVSLLAFTNDQRNRFPINSKSTNSNTSPSDSDDLVFEPTALGRYPEDTYNGYTSSPSTTGNPWFLCTSSASSILYHTASHLTTTSNLTITPTNLPFYTALLASSSLRVEIGMYSVSDALFHSVVEALGAAGDGFLEIVKSHVGGEGEMSEQFDKGTGFMTGARDLTWSYGAFLGAVRGRRGLLGL